jgi:hypothetical protein
MPTLPIVETLRHKCSLQAIKPIINDILIATDVFERNLESS